MMRLRPPTSRMGFSLVELLVVIAIIAVLAALLIAGVTRSQEKIREVRVVSDMKQLETALGSFQGKFRTLPPCFGGGTNGTFRLCSDYPAATDTWPEKKFMMRLFPRMNTADNGLRDANDQVISHAQPVLLDGNQCLVFFLSGGSYTEYFGFSTDPTQPFKRDGARMEGMPYFEFPKSRMVTPAAYTNDEITNWTGTRFSGDAAPSTEVPWFVDPWGNPYLYFASNNGNDYPFDAGHPTQTDSLHIGPWGGQYSMFNNATQGPRPFRESATKFINPKTFQIVSAGRDGVWGVGQQASGQAYKPGDVTEPLNQTDGPNSYSASHIGGGDDFANFATGKLGTPE